MYSFIWTCSIWCLDLCFYIEVLILWFRTCFEVGINLCVNKFLLWYHCCLWKVMHLFLWLIFDTYLLCVVCGVFVFLSILYKPTIYQLFWRLEVIGWLEKTVHAYTFVILYFLVCIDGLHRAKSYILFICYYWCILPICHIWYMHMFRGSFAWSLFPNYLW